MFDDLARMDRMIKRLFGPAAEVTGHIGSPLHPGHVQILLGGKPLASGPNVDAALRVAGQAAARLAAAKTQQRMQ